MIQETERYQLEAYRAKAGKGVSWIAREKGICRQTNYNELRRGQYPPVRLQEERALLSGQGPADILPEAAEQGVGRKVSTSQIRIIVCFGGPALTGLQPMVRRDKWKLCSPAVGTLECGRREGFSTSRLCGDAVTIHYCYQGRTGRARAWRSVEAPTAEADRRTRTRAGWSPPHH